uniref:Uncharacterized protein n=1 Tax=Mycena chlorophos TaxID=658473 RepID=A0ABQ0LLU4_MYCCL|nr:predicted protein [Mycena chlorophos]
MALSKCIRRLTNRVAFLKLDGCMHLILHRSRYPSYHVILPQRRSNPSTNPPQFTTFSRAPANSATTSVARPRLACLLGELRNDVRGATRARIPTQACPRPCGWMRSVSSLRQRRSHSRCKTSLAFRGVLRSDLSTMCREAFVERLTDDDMTNCRRWPGSPTQRHLLA